MDAERGPGAFRRPAVFIWILVFLLGGTMAYALFNTDLKVEGQGLRVIPAADRADLFREQTGRAAIGAFDGMVYASGMPDDPDGCEYRVYTLRLRDLCPVPAERVEFSVYPSAGDILMYQPVRRAVISPGESLDLSFVILTKTGGGDTRDIRLTYYLWGNKCETRYVYH